MAIDVQMLRRRLDAITDLPTLPQVAAQIASLILTPSTNAAEIGRLIEHDPSLTARILKLVNSAYYGFPQRISSVQHAVVILGFNKIKNVVMAVSVYNVTRLRASRLIDPVRMWQHSIAAAIAAKEILSDIAPAGSPEDAFTGGLLHDFGKIIYDQYLPDLYEPVENMVRYTGGTVLHAEQERIGVTHAAIGRWLAERWRLPAMLQNVIAYHHQPARASEYADLTAAVHLADAFIRALGIGQAGDDSINPLDESVVSRYNVDKNWIQQILERIVRELDRARVFFDMVDEQP